MGTTDICELVIKEITDSSLSVNSIAKKSGISEATIRGWLRGKGTPSIANAQFVLSVLGKELCIKEKTTNGQ